MPDAGGPRAGTDRTAIEAQRRTDTLRLAVMCGAIGLVQAAVLYLSGAIRL